MFNFSENIINPKLYDIVLEKIKILIEIKTEYKSVLLILDDYKDISKQLSFKINSYKKWLIKLKSINENDDENDNFSTKNNIKKHKLSSSLEKKIIEINDTGNLKEIDDTKKLIEEIKNKTSKEFKDKKNNKNKGYFKNDNKILDYEQNDLLNLQRIHGFGEKTAIKMLKQGIKLELLLEEWQQFINTNNFQLVPDSYLNLQKLINDKSFSFNSKERSNYIENKFKSTKYLKYLNYGQLIGIKYFHDIEKRIPRKEITKIKEVVEKLLKLMNNKIIMEVCGSYRRGCKDSGDIDILITHPDYKTSSDTFNQNKNILTILICHLQTINFLKDHLTIDGKTKYMGICKIKDIYRRIDIRFIPYDSFPCALLYFTGSANLNKEMRQKAQMKNYKLSEYSLSKMEFNKKTNKLEEYEIIPIKSESDVFEYLDMTYKLPTERNT